MSIILILIIILTKIVAKILVHNFIILKNDKIYNITHILGIYLPLCILIVSLSFKYTDTILDFIIVLFLVIIVLSSIVICSKFIYHMKNGWLSISGVMVITFICHIIAKQHLLVNLPSGFLICFICIIIAGYIISDNISTNVLKLKITTISVILMFLIIYTTSLLNNFKLSNMSKPITYAFKVAKEKGYEITSYDIVITSSISSEHLGRYSPIKISIVRLKDYATTVRDIEIIYYKNNIIDFKDNLIK